MSCLVRQKPRPVGGGVSAGNGACPVAWPIWDFVQRADGWFQQSARPATFFASRHQAVTTPGYLLARGRNATSKTNSGAVVSADQMGRRTTPVRFRSTDPRHSDAPHPEPTPPRRSKPVIATGWRQSCRCSDHLVRDRQKFCRNTPAIYHVALPGLGTSANAAAEQPMRSRPPVRPPGRRIAQVGSELSFHDQAYVDRRDPRGRNTGRHS